MDDAARAIAASDAVWESTFEARPWWQAAQSFADESPGYPIVCSSGVKSCSGSG